MSWKQPRLFIVFIWIDGTASHCCVWCWIQKQDPIVDGNIFVLTFIHIFFSVLFGGLGRGGGAVFNVFSQFQSMLNGVTKQSQVPTTNVITVRYS